MLEGAEGERNLGGCGAGHALAQGQKLQEDG